MLPLLPFQAVLVSVAPLKLRWIVRFAPVQAQRAVLQQHGLEFVGGFAVPGGDLGQPCAQRVDGALAAGGAVGQGELWERRLGGVRHGRLRPGRAAQREGQP